MIIGTLVVSSRLLLGSLFLMSSATKLSRPSAFERNILQYRLLPAGLAKAFALSLPWLELGIGLLLLSGHVSRLAGGMAAFLLAMFLLAIASALARKLGVNCSCFGLLYQEPIGPRTLARDAVLVILGIVVLSWGPSAPSLAETLESPGQLANGIVLLATSVTILASALLAFLAYRYPAIRPTSPL